MTSTPSEWIGLKASSMPVWADPILPPTLGIESR